MQPPHTDPPEYWVVDGLEDTPAGQVARLERPDGQTVLLARRDLPEEVQEGDVLEVLPGPDGTALKAAPEQTRQRRLAAQTRLDALNSAAAEGEEITL